MKTSHDAFHMLKEHQAPHHVEDDQRTISSALSVPTWTLRERIQQVDNIYANGELDYPL